MTSRASLSILDFCTIYEGETAAQSMARSVELAQQAEKLGFTRMWYTCLLYTSPSPRDATLSRMPSSA